MDDVHTLGVENLNNVINIDGTQAILMDGQYYIPLFPEDDNQYILNTTGDFLLNDAENIENTAFNASEIVHLIDETDLEYLCKEDEVVYLPEDLKNQIQNDEHNYQISIDNIEPSLKRMNLENEDLEDAMNLLENIENIPEIAINEQEFHYVVKCEGETGQTLQPNKTLDISKITGKNLLTGQIVTLDNYMEKLNNSAKELISEETNKSALANLLNKKLTLGKTPTGQKLVGKVVSVKKAAQTMTPKESPLKDEITEQTMPEYVSKTLTNLMEVESVAKELKRKTLLIKINEKCMNNGVTSVDTIQMKGHLETRSGSEYFILHEENTKRKFQNSIRITISITQLDGLVKSTKVSLHPCLEKCPVCFKQFKTRVKLRTHMRLIHNVQTRFYCELCDQSYTSREHQQMHIDKKELFKCEECPKVFLSEIRLGKHFQSHDPNQVYKFNCTECDSVLENVDSWRRHTLEHTNGVKPYACSICSKQFFTKGDLNYHSKVHDPKNRYPCKVCNRTFSRYSNLQRHSKIHRTKNSVSAYSCSECGCTYNYVSSLTRHIVQNHIAAS